MVLYGAYIRHKYGRDTIDMAGTQILYVKSESDTI